MSGLSEQSSKRLLRLTSKLPWKTAWVTGASSGIGRELALQLAQAGVKVAASARSAGKLAELQSANPNIRAFPLDVTDGAAVAATVAAAASQLGPIDLAIFCAAVWHPMGASDYNAETAIEAINVNYNGVVQPLAALLPAMLERRAGHVAFVGSVAGLRGLPKSVTYSPSKAALISLAETLKLDLERSGVGISIINPGFVDTPMVSVNKCPMPFMVTAPDAAARMIDGLKRGKFEIGFPWPTFKMMKLFRKMPNQLYFLMTRFMQPLGSD